MKDIQKFVDFDKWRSSGSYAKRSDYEWSKVWDGSIEDGIRINDIQCERIDKYKKDNSITDEELKIYRMQQRMS